MTTPVLLVLGGLVGLVVGSELTVSAAQRLAKRLGVSGWLIGLTLASVGTSLPEISTNVAAAWSTRGGVDASELAVGNVVGSCVSQITLLLGFTALLSPLALPKYAGRRDLTSAVIALLAMGYACFDGVVTFTEALGLIGAYVLYVGVCLFTEPRHTEDPKKRPTFGILQVLVGIFGMVLVVLAAHWVVSGGVELAEALGLDRTTIGMMVGLGTGLPELAIALRAVFAGAGSLSLGNLIGSNITDPLLTLGTGAAVHPLTVQPEVLVFDLPAWLLLTLVAIVFLRTGRTLTRLEGLLLMLLFIGYAAIRGALTTGMWEGVGFDTLPWA